MKYELGDVIIFKRGKTIHRVVEPLERFHWSEEPVCKLSGVTGYWSAEYLDTIALPATRLAKILYEIDDEV